MPMRRQSSIVLDEELVAFRAVHLRGQQRGHELGRVVRLEIGRLVGDQSVGGGMRLVEAIAAEELDQLEDLRRPGWIQPALDGPLDELLLARRDDVHLLLRDGLDRRVRLGQLDAAQAIEDPHDLFLVDHHPVGLFQDVLHHRMLVLGLLPAMLPVDVGIDHAAVQRAGPVQGEDGDEVLEAVGLHLDQQVADARAIELEDAQGLAALEQFVGWFVVQRQGIQVEGRIDRDLEFVGRRRRGRSGCEGRGNPSSATRPSRRPPSPTGC